MEWRSSCLHWPGGGCCFLCWRYPCLGHSVGADRLSELIWPESQPSRVRASLQTLASRLRVVMPAEIVTTGDGYMLDVAADQVDLLRFRRLVRAAGKADDDPAKLDLLDEALGLWRGDPLSDPRSAALDRNVIPALTDERLAAVVQQQRGA